MMLTAEGDESPRASPPYDIAPLSPPQDNAGSNGRAFARGPPTANGQALARGPPTAGIVPPASGDEDHACLTEGKQKGKQH